MGVLFKLRRKQSNYNRLEHTTMKMKNIAKISLLLGILATVLKHYNGKRCRKETYCNK